MTEKKKRIHPDLLPEKLAWACSTPNRLRAHRKRLQDAGLPLPDCIETTHGKTPTEKRIIRQARDKMVAYGEYIYERNRLRDKDLRRKFDGRIKEMAENEAVLPKIAEKEAQIPDPDAETVKSYDGQRIGDKEPEKKGFEKTPGDHRIEYEVLPSFVEFSEDLSPTVWALVGPAGGGKSVAAIMKMLAHCSLLPQGARYVIIRNTYRMLYDTTIPTFFEWVPRSLGKWDASNEKFTLGGKYEFLFRSCERPEDVDKFKGIEITGYFMNEAMEIKEEIKQLLDQRVGRYPKESYTDEFGITRYRGTDKTLSILDSNPPDTEHWLFERFVRQPLKDHKLVLQPPYENAHNLPKNYYENMRERYRDAPDLIRRYVEGKWGAVYMGKAVYPEFDSRVHVSSQPLKMIPGLPMFCGLDFGLTPAIVWSQVRPNGTWAILAELWGDNVALDEFGDAIIRYTGTFFPNAPEYYWYGDPSGFKRSETDAKSVAEILAKKNIILQPGAITVAERLEAVRRRLRLRDGLLVSPTCTRLIDGFSGAYAYKEITGTQGSVGQKIYSDKPAKNKWSHIHDALQYIATSLFSMDDRNREDQILEQLKQEPLNAKVGW